VTRRSIRHVSEVLADVVKDDPEEPVSDDARMAILDGLSRAQKPPRGWGLPLGWHGVEIIE
jgi:hypothetical protein